MKIYVFVLLIMATVAIALPMEDELLDENDWVLLDLLENKNETLENNLLENINKTLELQLAPVEEDHPELRVNFLCKFLGDGFNHRACAIYCILKRKKGGRCTEEGVCLCRK